MGNPLSLELNVMTVGFTIVLGLIHLAFFSVTISMAKSLFEKKKIHLQDAFKDAAKKFHHLAIGTTVVFVPVYGLILAIQYLANLASDMQGIKIVVGIAASILTIATVFLVLLIVEFIPIFVVIENQKWIQAILKSGKFVKKSLVDIIILNFVGINIQLIASILSALFLTIPLLGESVFLVIFKGISDCLVYCLSVVFFLQITTAKKVQKIPAKT